MTPRVLPVGAFVFLFRELLEADPLLSDLWLEGEVSDFSRSSAGHYYFSLSDDDGTLKCVLFRRDALRQHQLPQLGAQVAIHGILSIYPRSGSVQLQADLVRPAGLGAAWLERERLRQRLEAEGVFDPQRKRALPALPRTVGVVTSPQGAAWHDIQQVIRRRFPAVRLLLAPAQVQGSEAVTSIVAAIDSLQREENVDVIILARGGGASDDLSTFNDERVVKSVFGSRIPVVVGIGHATDRTLVEEAADVVAPTPSAAAEVSVPSAAALGDQIDFLTLRLDRALRDVHAAALESTRGLESKLRSSSPGQAMPKHEWSIDHNYRKLRLAFDRVMTADSQKSAALTSILRALSPEAVLRRGYAVLESADDGRALYSAADVESGARVKAALADGTIYTRVEEVRRSTFGSVLDTS